MAGSKIFDRAEDLRIVAGFVDYAREEHFLHEVPQGHLLQAVVRDPSVLDRFDRDELHAAFSRLQQLVHQRMSLNVPLDPNGQDDRPTMPPPGAARTEAPDRSMPPMPAEIRSRIAALRLRVVRMHEEASDVSSRSEELLGLRVHFNRFSAAMARIDGAMGVAPPLVRGKATAFLDRMEKDLAATERILRIDDGGELDEVADEVMTDLSMARGYHVEKSPEGRQEARALERLGKAISDAIVSGRVFTVRLAVIEAHLRAQRLLEPLPVFPEHDPLPPPREEQPTLQAIEPETEPQRDPAPSRAREDRQEADPAGAITQATDECQRLLGVFGRDEVSGHIVQRYRQLQFIMASHFDEGRVVELIWAIRSDLEMVDRIHRARDRRGTDEETFRVLVQEVRGESIAALQALEQSGGDAAAMRGYAQKLIDDYSAFRTKPEALYEELRQLLLKVHVEAVQVLTPYGKLTSPRGGGDDNTRGPAGEGGKKGAPIGGFAAGAQGLSSARAINDGFHASILATIGLVRVPVCVAAPAILLRGALPVIA